MCRKLSFLLSFVLVLGLAGNAWGLLLAERDIGEPVLAGSATYDDVNDRWVVLGAGADIGGSADQFYYVFRPLGNNGVLKVNLDSMDVTSSKAMAGVMIRDGLDGDSKHVMMSMTGTEGNRALWRTTAGGDTDTKTWGGSGQATPKKMWVSRNGNTVTATFWYVVIPGIFEDWWHEDISISMSADVYIGLVVSSHNIGELCEGVFEDVVWPTVPYPKAWNPSPADGAPQVPGDVILQWLPGDTADTHDVYIGTDPNALAPVCEDLPLAQTSCDPGVLEGGTTYYWRVVEVEADGVTEHPGPVWSFYKTYFEAHNPSPADGADTMPLDVTLNWLPGDTTAMHEVYFGTAPAALNPVALKVLGDESYTPDTLLEATTYYWQIIEVEADGTTKYPGDVWSFNTLYLKAYNPSPADEEMRVSLTPTLSWTAGDAATTHDVYFGDDPAALAHVATLALGEESYEPDANNIDPDTDYYWQVVESNSLGPAPGSWTGDVWSFRTARVVTGTIRREVWEGIGGGIVSDLTGHPDYPANPTWTDEITLFDSPGFADNYGARIIGYLVPETSGDYRFWIASDDQSELWLSTSEAPREAVKIAGVPAWSGYRNWTQNPEQESELISLEANKKYFIMALWKEGGGGDHCSVAWEGPDISRDVIEGYCLMPFDYLWAWAPSPKDGAEDVPVDVTLSWLLGKDAFLHAVYFGDNYEDVLYGEPDTYKGLQFDPSYVPGILDLTKTYYWAADTIWHDGRDFGIKIGAVWSFTIEEYRLIEDFESYDVEPEALPEQVITLEAVPPPNQVMIGGDYTVYAKPVPDDFLMAYYMFEGDANDSSGNGFDGTLLGDANVATGVLDLDGDGDCVDVGNNMMFNPAGSFSISVWAKLNSWGGSWGNVIVGKRGESGVGWQLRQFSNKKVLSFTTRGIGNDDARGKRSPSLGEWHHIAATYDGSKKVVYIDGLKDVEYGASGTINPCDHNVYIGARANGDNSGPESYFDGMVDELRIFGFSALSYEQVLGLAGIDELYVPPIYSPLVAEYTFDTGDANDSSGNGHDGTLAGNASIVAGELVLDGDGDYVDLGNPPALNFSTGDWSVCALVKTSSMGGTHVIYTNGGDGGGGCRIMLSMGEGNEHKITLTVDDDSSKVEAKGGTIVDDDMWHHVIGVREGDTIRVYVDGKPDGSAGLPGGFDLSGTAQANAYIGTNLNYGNGSLQKFFNGTIDNVQVYDYALSEGEARYLAGLGHVYRPLLAHFEFDGNYDDSSGNDVIATPFGAVGLVSDSINEEMHQVLSLPGGDDQYVGLSEVGVSGSMPRTIACWAKADHTSPTIPDWTLIFGFTGNADGGGGCGSHFNIGSLNADRVGAHAWCFEATIFSDEEALEWRHYAMTYDGTTITYYGDGVLKGSSAINLTHADRVHIGSRATQTSSFPGKVEDARIYDYPLSHGQIVTLAIEEPNPLSDTWVDDGNVVSSLGLSLYGQAYDGAQSMKMEYTGDGKVTRLVPFDDFSAANAKALVLYFKGEPGNTATDMYVELTSNNPSQQTVGVMYDGDANDVKNPDWQQWDIALSDFDGVPLTHIQDVAIGVTGSSGVLYFDELRLHTTRCVPKYGPYGDITDDCVVNSDDLRILIGDYLEGDYTVALPEQQQIGGDYWIYAVVPDDNELLAHYKLDGDPNDSGPYGFHGTELGDPTYAAGVIDQAIDLDRSNCVQIEHDEVFNPPGGFSISAWFNMSGWGNSWGNVIVGKRGEGQSWQLRRRGGSQRLCFTVRGTSGGDDPQGNITPTLGEWHHVVAVFDPDAGQRTVYLNNRIDKQIGDGGTIAEDTKHVYIGARSNGDNTGPEQQFDGMIDDVHFYNYALAPLEVLYLFTGNVDVYVPPVYSPLKIHYKFDGNADDASGNNYHGKVRGGAGYAAAIIDQGIDLDSGDDFVYTGKYASDLGIDGANPRTVTAWVFTRDFDNGGIFDAGRRSGRRDFCLRTRGGNNQWRIQYWGADKDFTYDSHDKWVHFALTYENSLTKIYADGEHIVDHSATLRTPDNNPFQVGCYGWQNDYFGGIIDDVRVFDYALGYWEVQCVLNNSDDVYVPLESRAELYSEEPENFRKINLKDYAYIADDWLETQLFPAE